MDKIFSVSISGTRFVVSENTNIFSCNFKTVITILWKRAGTVVFDES